MCLGSGGSRLRPSDVDSGKPGFTSRTLRSAFLEPQGAVPQALSLSRGARFLAFLGEGRRGSRHFWNHRACVGYGPVPDSHIKRNPWGARQISGTYFSWRSLVCGSGRVCLGSGGSWIWIPGSRHSCHQRSLNLRGPTP